MMTDPISDFLTRIRNGLMVRKSVVEAKASGVVGNIAENLKRKGYIKDYSYEQSGATRLIKVQLKYDVQGLPVVEHLRRISKPGLRVYKKASELERIRVGLGIAIVSTSKGVMTSGEASEKRLGGEVLCYVW